MPSGCHFGGCRSCRNHRNQHTAERSGSNQKNYRMVVLYSTISPGVDILFTASILLSIPYGTYSIAEGLLIGIVIAVIFTPFCLISSYRLQKRMSQLKEEIVKDNWMGRINCLNYCPIFKFIFFLFLGILVFGVGYF